MTRRLAVVVAHPDDETFGLGSVLLHAAAAGASTTVVCATRGEAGDPAPGVDVPAEGVGALRERELHEAAWMLGVDDVELLGFADSGMDGEPAPGTLCAAPGEVVAKAVADALDRLRPDVVVTLDGSDGHRDHGAVRDAVLAATARTPARVYLHALPRSLMHAWVLERAGDEKAAAYTELPEIGTPDVEVTTMLDTAAHYEARMAAIARHRSQESPFALISEDLRRRFLTADHLVRVFPVWAGGPVETDLWD